eukprot:6943688-Alexandrium_andersonii.AAC.1
MGALAEHSREVTTICETPQAFRAEWALTTLKQRQREKKWTKSYHTVDEDCGEYMPLGAIVLKLG